MNANLSQQINDGFSEGFGRSASIFAAEAIGQTLNELVAPITPILRFFYKDSFRFGSETVQRSSSESQRTSRISEELAPASSPVSFQLPVESESPEVGDDLDFYPPHTHWGINE
jgi:predicted DNA-binding protein